MSLSGPPGYGGKAKVLAVGEDVAVVKIDKKFAEYLKQNAKSGALAYWPGIDKPPVGDNSQGS
jgi:hypothetical protein